MDKKSNPKLGKSLTDREKFVLLRLSLGDSYKEIADQFGVVDSVVDRAAKSIRHKLGARTMFQAMYLWTLSRPRFHIVERDSRAARG